VQVEWSSYWEYLPGKQLFSPNGSCCKAFQVKQLIISNINKQYCLQYSVYFCCMLKELEILKGIHPGIVLDRKLKEKHLPKGKFALYINEYPQTITAITKGKRKMNTALAIKIEEALGLEEGYFMTLQVFYDIKQERLKQDTETPDLSKLLPVTFWDTNMEKIKWKTQARAVIERVFERGNKEEQEEIIRFYGREKVEEVLNKLPGQKVKRK